MAGVGARVVPRSAWRQRCRACTPKEPPTNVKALGSRRVELSDPKASPAHWKALSVKLSERFPSYALAYMVEYGVYGLALSKARE